MKVTKEVYTKVKQNRLVTELSKRTINNIKKTKNYSEYQQKFVKNRKIKSENDFIAGLLAQHELNTKDELSFYFGRHSKDYQDLNKLLIINLTVTVIGFAVLIAMIAW